jgi:osmotically-inducible protein OsmY
MAERPIELDAYLAEHLREALAQDPRVGELDVAVAIDGEQIVLRGRLPSPASQAAAAEIARRFAPGHIVVDETVVAEFPESTETEHFS